MAVKTFTAGSVLTAADTNTYLNNGGLVYVKEQTIGTSVTSVTVTGAFSSTYDDYLIRVTNVSSSTDNNDVNLQLRTGSTTANTNYYYIYQYVSYSGTSSTFAAGNNYTTFAFVGRSTNDTVTCAIDIAQPFLARRTNLRAITPGGNISGTMHGFHNAATSYDQFVLGFAAAVTGGTITVYGYRKG